MNTKEWKNLGDYFLFEEYKIFFRDNKTHHKPVILLLHGFPTASWDWYKIWNKLKDDFHLITFDFLGFGFSDKPRKNNYSIHQQSDIALNFLQHLGIEKYHIIAHDYGVSVAQELYARNIEKNIHDIQSICFLNGGIFAEMHRPVLIQKLMISPIGGLLPLFIGKSSLKRNFKKIFGKNTQASEEEIQSFWELVSFNNGKWVFPKLIRYMLDRKKYRDRWCLPLIQPRIPIRLINGNQDPISGKHVVERYLELYPDADTVNLASIGHYPNTEAPDAVIKYYKEFYQNHFKE